MPELDPQAITILKSLQPGDLFTCRDEKNIFKCTSIEHPVERESWVRAMEMEGPKGRRTPRMYRSVMISRIDRILEEK